MAPAAEMTAEELTASAAYNLTQKMAPYLDKHLLLPMLHFFKELNIYDDKDIVRAQLQLLNETNMLDLAVEMYEELGEEPPEGYAEKREQVVAELVSKQASVLKLLELLEDDDAVREIQNLKSITEICEAFDVTLEQVEGLATLAKMKYECGDYALSAELLKHYRNMMDKDSERVMTTKSIASIWGSIAAFLLKEEYDEATDHIVTLNDFLENAKLNKRELLLQKTWLLHWSLFAIFRSDNSPQRALDIVLHEKSLSVISLSCPQLFRYVSACLILNKRLKLALKDTIWIIQQEKLSYQDPITRFLVALYVDLDFDLAQTELQECRKVCKTDYFLAHHWEDFEENARLLIFEMYCRIHQCINIGMISAKLNMTPTEAELWIVKLIQSAKLDARIDSEKSRVVMSKAPPSVYHQVIEKTKSLSFRNSMLLSNLEKKENEKKGLGNII